MTREAIAIAVEGPAPEAPADARGELVLGEADAETYVARVQRAVRAGRANAFFPPTAQLCAHLGFLGPGGSCGLYEQLRLSPVSGLPAPREILRVKIDKDLAPSFLEDAAARPPPPPESRLARRIAYYCALARVEVAALNRMTVELRQQVPDEQRALFRVVFDRFDLAASQFVRYTILLAQRDRFWSRPHVQLERDLAAATEGFRRTVARLASHEAEVAFILLSEVHGIEVEDVRRCRVGPLLLPGARVGAALERLLDPEAADAPPWMLCFPEDRAGRDVAAHASGDPLGRLFREALGEQARRLVDAKADELGYRVAKARKFVCPESLRGRLQGLLRELGVPCVVYGVPPAAPRQHGPR
jgi:hypothetical protein